MSDAPLARLLDPCYVAVAYDAPEGEDGYWVSNDVGDGNSGVDQLENGWMTCIDDELEDILRVDLDTALGASEYDLLPPPFSEKPRTIRGMLPLATQQLLEKYA